MFKLLNCLIIALCIAAALAACKAPPPQQQSATPVNTASTTATAAVSPPEDTLVSDVRARLAAQLFADYPAMDVSQLDNMVLVQLKEGARITVQPGVELVTAKPLQFAAIPEDEGYWLIYREHSNIAVRIHDDVVRTEPDNTSPDARYITSGAESFDVISDSFTHLNVNAGVTVCFDITRVKDKIGYLWPQSWKQPEGTHFFVEADQTDIVMAVDREHLLYVFDRELPPDATNCAPGDAQILRGRFLLLAGAYSPYESVWAIDALLPQPVLLDSGTCIPISGESELLGSVDAGEYMLMLSYDFGCDIAPESLLGFYRLAEANEPGKLRFDMNMILYNAETLRSHNGYRNIVK